MKTHIGPGRLFVDGVEVGHIKRGTLRLQPPRDRQEKEKPSDHLPRALVSWSVADKYR